MYWLRKNIFLVVGGILLMGGVLFFIGEYFEVEGHQRGVEKEIADNWEGVKSQEELKKINPEYDDNVEKSVIDGRELARTKITDEMIGVIRSDVIRLNEPIYMGASEMNMRRGVSTVGADELLDEQTVAISGHRSNVRYQYFTEILNLKKGNEVIIETKGSNGETVETVYIVERSYKVEPTDIGILEEVEGEPRKLVLITCDEWNPKTKLYDKRWVTEAYIKG